LTGYTLSGYVKSLVAIWTFRKFQCWSSRFSLSDLKLSVAYITSFLKPWEANAVHRCIKLCPQLLANNWHRKSQ
jgi:hypothetical protein